jgi:hypothetical protein
VAFDGRQSGPHCQVDEMTQLAAFRDSLARLTLQYVAVGVLLLTGCNSSSSGPAIPNVPLAKVKGTITYNGEPVTEGLLNLDAGKGYIVTGLIARDGTFELESMWGKEVPAGTYTVTVLPVPPKPGAVPTPEEMFEAQKKAKNGASEGLPKKFTNSTTSEVSLDIAVGEQEVKIELVD